jgi:hypothetical protein
LIRIDLGCLRFADLRVVAVSSISAGTIRQRNQNPGGLPINVFDGIRAGVVNDRAQFYKDLTMPFFHQFGVLRSLISVLQ